MVFRFRQFEVVDDFDQMWSVHSVIDRLTGNGVTSYLIRWQPVGDGKTLLSRRGTSATPSVAPPNTAS